ncbi:MAG: signal recognition particle protein Srp19 [Methanomassiliicoccus sp.]|nr:MAG: signal recognition particle protein Srp19 [Methanomassiliicoccus sp.]
MGGTFGQMSHMTVDPEKAIVLWPTYFDVKISREDGRRVPRRDAIDAPTAHMLYQAVRALNLDCILELDKAYPRFWYRKEGRVLVEPKLDKKKLVAEVAAKLKTTPREK